MTYILCNPTMFELHQKKTRLVSSSFCSVGGLFDAQNRVLLGLHGGLQSRVVYGGGKGYGGGAVDVVGGGVGNALDSLQGLDDVGLTAGAHHALNFHGLFMGIFSLSCV